jgi:hypothetical protein
VHARAACKEQDQNKENDYAYAADGVKAPILAVAPDGKTSHSRYDHSDREYEHEDHVLPSSLTVVGSGLAAPVWADSATRGSAISRFTLASTAWYDNFLVLLRDISGLSHSRKSIAVLFSTVLARQIATGPCLRFAFVHERANSLEHPAWGGGAVARDLTGEDEERSKPAPLKPKGAAPTSCMNGQAMLSFRRFHSGFVYLCRIEQQSRDDDGRIGHAQNQR